MLFNLVGVAIDVFFGFIGGMIGGAIFGTRAAQPVSPPTSSEERV